MSVETEAGCGTRSPAFGICRLLWPGWAERKRMLARDLVVVAVLCWCVTAVGCLYPQASSEASTPELVGAYVAFMLRTFRLHIGLVFGVCTLGAVLMGRRGVLLASLAGVALTIGPESTAWVAKPTPELADEMRVMTVNLLRSNGDYDAVLRQIEAVDPEIVLFQEYSSEFHQAFTRRLGQRYPYAETHPAEDCFGVAIHSRRPLVQTGKALFFLGERDIPALRVEVEMGERRAAVYAIHLLPPLRAYFREHLRQNEELRQRLASETLPAIVAGDFNMTDNTRAAEGLHAIGYRDAHVSAGSGRGATWPALGWLSRLPGIRIDHIYLSGDLDARDCRAGEACGSDHLPLTAIVGWRAHGIEPAGD